MARCCHVIFSTKRKLFCILLICTMLLGSAILEGQQGTTTPVTIRVTDPSGAGVAHSKIGLSPLENAPANAETGGNGRLLLDLKPGGYSLSVSAPGFKTWSERIVVDAAPANGSSQIIPVVLQVGEVGRPQVIYASDTLVLSDESDRAPIALSAADFHALPHVTIAVHNGHTIAAETYSGVALPALLSKISAPLGTDLRGNAMSRYLIATGSDGYSVVLSLAEVDPSFHEGQIIVADARDGQPLGKSGPFQLIVSEDKRPARWVHNLVSITLRDGR